MYGVLYPVGQAYMGNSFDFTNNQLKQRVHDTLDYFVSLNFDYVALTFHRGNWYNMKGDIEKPFLSGNISADGETYLNQLVNECVSRNLKPILYDWTSVKWNQIHSYTKLNIDKIVDFCKFYTNLSKLFVGDDRIMGIELSGNVWQNDFNQATSKEGCSNYVPLAQGYLDAVWSGDESRKVYLSPCPDFNTVTLEKNYWNPEMLNIYGPLAWRFFINTKLKDTNPETNPYYPHTKGETIILNWLREHNQTAIDEHVVGFEPTYPTNSDWVWNTQTLNWLTDWLHTIKIPLNWYWEGYGVIQGGALNSNTEYERTFKTSDGTERQFVEPLRSFLGGTTPTPTPTPEQPEINPAAAVAAILALAAALDSAK